MNDAYTILEITKEKNECKAVVSINWDAEIFKGHFPANAIFPGALLIKLSIELVSEYTKQVVSLDIQNVKFLRPVSEEIERLNFEFVSKGSSVSATCWESFSGEVVYKCQVLMNNI